MSPRPLATAPRKGKLKSKSKDPQSKAKTPAVTPGTPLENVDASDELEPDEDDDGDGVDEKGMARLLEVLGEDGLDEFEQAQLQALTGDEDWDTEEEGEDNGKQEMRESEVAVEMGESVESDDADEEPNKSDAEDDGETVEKEQDVALDDVESVDEDAVPQQKLEIDNKAALERIRDTIQLDPSLPWTETLTLSYPEVIDVDVDDDLNRELAFYKQALHNVNLARVLAAKHKLSFTRPSDYFAEMVKSDAHMERIRQNLLDEKAGIKKGEEKRKEREGKKFGKQVQLEKLKERERGKKEMQERLQGLKRKRKDALDKPEADDDGFDVAVEDAISDRPSKRSKNVKDAKMPRRARDQKFGFGGAGRRSKQNTKASTDDFDTRPRRNDHSGGKKGGTRSGGGGRGGGGGGGGGGGRGGSKRLGKSRRVSARSKT